MKKRKTCGLDVHKDTIFCAIFDGKKHSEVKEFSTLSGSIHKMGKELQSMGVKEIAIESTGIYWIPVWNILEAMGFKLMLVNPYLIKQMPGRKSDVKDAQWIATLLHKNLLRKSLIPNKTIRELRVYSRKYLKLQQRQTSVLQEIERCLEVCNIRITSLVSNISSKSVLSVVEALVNGQTDAEELVKLIHSRIVNKHSREKVIESLTGYLTPQHLFMLSLCLDELRLLEKQSEMCLEMMRTICYTHYSNEMKLLMTIPGISELSAMIVIAETGADMKAFENSGKFTGWTGLRPRNDESAGKYKSTAITKGNRYLRTILVQIAWAASRTKNSFFKETFSRLSMRKSSKKALIAIARKIAVVIWNLLRNNQPYNPHRQIIYNYSKLQAKINYHLREIQRMQNMLIHEA